MFFTVFLSSIFLVVLGLKRTAASARESSDSEREAALLLCAAFGQRQNLGVINPAQI